MPADKNNVPADVSLATFAERKLKNTDGFEPVALVRAHERVAVFLEICHKGAFRLRYFPAQCFSPACLGE